MIGKHFAKARFYDGSLGRMLAEDPVKRGLNGYSYCDSDPVNYTDPTGEIFNILAGGSAGAIAGVVVGGVFGFGGSALSQILSGEEFNVRKAIGAAANGAIVGGVRGALIGSGVGAGAALAADFGAGTLGSAAEQLIVNGRVSAKESLKDGLINAVTGKIYGNGKIESLGEALVRGSMAGGASSGLNYLSDAFTPRPGRLGGSTLNGLAGMMLMGAGSAFGRDPRRGCGTGSWDVDWIGERMAYGYQYGLNQTAQKKSGFSFAGFGKEVLAGAITGGLASVAFYGAGKAVEALAGSIRSNKGSISTDTELSNYYPSNNGAIKGTERNVYLMAGDKIDRYGRLSGKYFSPSGTPLEMRALPYNADLTQYRQFEVVKPFEVEASTIAPAFGKIGLGTQYRSPVSVNVLLNKGIIKIMG